MRDDRDGAEPSANSVAAMNLTWLARILNVKEFQLAAARLIGSFHPVLQRVPAALPQMLAAMNDTITEPIQIVIAGTRTSAAELLQVSRNRINPAKLFSLRTAQNQEFLAQHVPEIADMTPINGKATAYVCRNFACDLPVTDPDALRAKL